MVGDGLGGGVQQPCNNEASKMKAEIHPAYGKLSATCSCGNVIEVGSTLESKIHLDVCAQCHPFYTGKQKTADVGGRIDRFNQRFGGIGSGKK